MPDINSSPNQGVYKGGNTAFTYLIILAVAALMLFLGISGLLKKPIDLDDGFKNGFDSHKCYSGVPPCGSDEEYVDLSSSINGITVLHEHYYMIMSEDKTSIITVRAGKNFEKNFNSDFENIDEIEIKGVVKGLPHKVENALNDAVISGMRSGVTIEGKYFIDLLSTRINIVQIAIGAANIIIAICLAISSSIKRKAFDYGSKKAATIPGLIAGVLFIACGVGLIYLMLMFF